MRVRRVTGRLGSAAAGACGTGVVDVLAAGCGGAGRAAPVTDLRSSGAGEVRRACGTSALGPAAGFAVDIVPESSFDASGPGRAELPVACVGSAFFGAPSPSAFSASFN